MRAFDQQIVVGRTEEGGEGIGICELPGGRPIRRPEAIVAADLRRRPFEHALEEPGVVTAFEPHHHLALRIDHVEEFGVGHEGPHHRARRRLVWTQDREGIAMAPPDDRIDVRLPGRPGPSLGPVAHRAPFRKPSPRGRVAGLLVPSLVSHGANARGRRGRQGERPADPLGRAGIIARLRRLRPEAASRARSRCPRHIRRSSDPTRTSPCWRC